MDPFKSFVLDWLARTGWSQARLAEASGMSQSLLSKYLATGRRKKVRPSPDTLRRLAAVLGEPYEELLRMCRYLDGSPDPAPASDYDRELAAMNSEVLQQLLRIPEERRVSLLKALSVQVTSTVRLLGDMHDIALGTEPTERNLRALNNNRNAHRATPRADGRSKPRARAPAPA